MGDGRGYAVTGSLLASDGRLDASPARLAARSGLSRRGERLEIGATVPRSTWVGAPYPCRVAQRRRRRASTLDDLIDLWVLYWRILRRVWPIFVALVLVLWLWKVPGLGIPATLLVVGLVVRRFYRRRQRATSAYDAYLRDEALLRQEHLARAADLRDLLIVSPYEFEEIVASLLDASGFINVRVVGGAGDLAADITCDDSEGRRVVVQCKQYAPHLRVGSPEVQKFIGMGTVHHYANRLIFVTTADFTQPAIRLASEHGIELVGGRQLVGWARRIPSLSSPTASAEPLPEPEPELLQSYPPPDPTELIASPPELTVVPRAEQRAPPSETASPARWDQNHWRACVSCGTRTRWRDDDGQALCERCVGTTG